MTCVEAGTGTTVNMRAQKQNKERYMYMYMDEYAHICESIWSRMLCT